MKKNFSIVFASGGGIGFIPGMPGTYGSFAATLAYYLVYRIHFRILPELLLSAICLLSVLGILTSARVSRDLGNDDPSIIVVDEIAGQLLAFLFLPVNLRNLALGFLLFRFFDILKPFPIRKLEQLKNGVGIMADDLLAGIYANLILQLLNRAI